MTQPTQKAPAFASHRDAIAAADPLVIASEALGMNFSGKEWAHFSIEPIGGADPTIRILAWDPLAGRFMRLLETDANPAAQGANVAYHVSVRAAGRILMARVHAIAAGSVTVNASGWDANGGAA